MGTLFENLSTIDSQFYRKKRKAEEEYGKMSNEEFVNKYYTHIDNGGVR